MNNRCVLSLGVHASIPLYRQKVANIQILGKRKTFRLTNRTVPRRAWGEYKLARCERSA
jgi:hypothetical protein